MSKATRATQALAKAGVSFTTHSYAYDPDAESIGMAAAAALGADPGRVLKTLMVLLDGKPACVIAPSDHEVSMKKLAAALKGKSAAMMKVPDAERISGYKVGGVSPFGQTRRVPVAIEERDDPRERLYQRRPAGLASVPGAGRCGAGAGRGGRLRRGLMAGCETILHLHNRVQLG
jgi:Cys-tRNA(Pro)/Cys-tRNA(Cys) deacylase